MAAEAKKLVPLSLAQSPQPMTDAIGWQRCEATLQEAANKLAVTRVRSYDKLPTQVAKIVDDAWENYSAFTTEVNARLNPSSI